MKRLRLLLAMLLLAASPAPRRAPRSPVRAPAARVVPVPPPASPALWKVADKDTTIYLFGTIHVLPAKLKWRTPAIDAALAASDTLVLETVLDEAPGRIATILATMGQAEGLPALDARVPPAQRAALLALLRSSGFPLAGFTSMKTWAAGVVLSGAALSSLGLGADAIGVEPQLEADFRRAGKPVEGLETPEQQLGYFDKLPEDAQRAFLLSTLDSPAEQKKEFDDEIAAWRRGDVAALAESFAVDPEFTPALRDALIRQRDRAWTRAIIRRLRTPGTVFVAVGAGHLAGPDSVQAMLAERGIEAIRVQ